MHKISLLIFFIIFSTFSFGQTKEELEYDLSWFRSPDNYEEKIESAKKLHLIDPLNDKAIKYICRYYSKKHIDSISIFFENLIAKFPNNSKLHYIRADLVFCEINYSENKEEYLKKKIKYLMDGYNINPKDSLILSELAEVYYRDFIYPLEKEKDLGITFIINDPYLDSILKIYEKEETKEKKSIFNHPADSAIKYYYQLWDLIVLDKDLIFYPIKQLECYLNKSENSPIPKSTENSFEQCFLPSKYFANLINNWTCDYSVNLNNEISNSRQSVKYLTTRLLSLQEPCLYNKEIDENTIIYRFTWLRSFHEPIAVRIEKHTNGIILYWKIGKGESGYTPKGLDKFGQKQLKEKDWRKFKRLVKKSNYNNLPVKYDFPMTDGASWNLERKTYNSYKTHYTNSPGQNFEKACLFLISLADIKINKDEIY